MRRKASDRKREVLSFLQSANARGGSFPTPAELEAAICSDALISQNFAKPVGRRGPATPSGFFSILPVAGTVAAGFGDPTEPVELGVLPVDLPAMNIHPSSRTFALRVRGDSMTGAHIVDGDLVVIEAREPKIGEIVAALIDGETTLKRFVNKDGDLFLKAENPRYPDLIPLHELTIQGVLRAVVRVCDRPRPVL